MNGKIILSTIPDIFLKGKISQMSTVGKSSEKDKVKIKTGYLVRYYVDKNGVVHTENPKKK